MHTALSDDDVVVYPEEFIERYRAAGAWRDRTIAEEFREIARRYPDRLAVVGPDQALTYQELDERADLVAIGLRDLGVTPGDTALLQITNSAEAIVVWYGLLKAGAVPVATLAFHREHEILELARQCDPVIHIIEPGFARNDLQELARRARSAQHSLRLLLTVGDAAQESTEDAVSVKSLLEADVNPVRAREIIDEIQRGIPSTSVGVLQLSGGTTSIPKLIPRLHTEYWYNSSAWAEAVEMDEHSCVAHLLPIMHNAGTVCAVHAAHSVGACVSTCMPDGTQFEAVAARHPITHILLMRPILPIVESVPSVEHLLKDLRVLIWGDGVVPPAVIERYETDLCRVTGMFGMGEGLCMVTPAGTPPQLAHGTQGTPITPYDEVRVLKPDSEEPAALGESGELCVRGPYTIRGYFRAGERNAAAFTAEGFYRSGDIVREIRHEGRSYYRLEDRIKDLINRGGEKINAEEVELILSSHPDVERAAVVAMPDPRLGERSCAFLVVRSGAQPPDLAEVKRHFEARGVAKYKWPERVEHRATLPLTNIQKVNKRILRQEITEIVEAEQKQQTGLESIAGAGA